MSIWDFKRPRWEKPAIHELENGLKIKLAEFFDPTGFKLGFALLELAASLGFEADLAREEWRRETVNTLQEMNIYWGNTRETKLATLRCVPASRSA